MKSPSSDIATVVEAAALELVNRHSLDEIESILHGSGVPTELAARLVLLIPSAFAAARYEPDGIEFPSSFLIGTEGNMRQFPYSSEPAYGAAKTLATRWLQEGRPSLVARVLDWSAEANAIKEALAKGLTPAKLSSVSHGANW